MNDVIKYLDEDKKCDHKRTNRYFFRYCTDCGAPMENYKRTIKLDKKTGMPIFDRCPKCGRLLTHAKNKTFCAYKQCGYIIDNNYSNLVNTDKK